MKGTLHAEFEVSRAKEILNDKSGTDIDQAWAFWVGTNMCFAHVLMGGFAFSSTSKQPRATANKRNNFNAQYLNRLSEAEIFNRDAINSIKLKDSENTFFYIDPPYLNAHCGHYKGYTADNFNLLLTTLGGIKGKFLLK